MAMTGAERALIASQQHKDRGSSLQKSHPPGRYITDFHCHEIKLVIEVDRGTHNARLEYGENRDGYPVAGR
jgi:very-short-patch-repair endonuclease